MLQVDTKVRGVRFFLPADMPSATATATEDAKKLAAALYAMIDDGTLVISIVDTPDKRFAKVLVTAGGAKPDQVRITVCRDLAHQAALSEVDRVLSGEQAQDSTPDD
jgi:hypothetical protein